MGDCGLNLYRMVQVCVAVENGVHHDAGHARRYVIPAGQDSEVLTVTGVGLERTPIVVRATAEGFNSEEATVNVLAPVLLARAARPATPSRRARPR